MFARAETETLREGIHCPVAARSFICFIGKFITHHRRELLHGFFFFFYMRCLSQGVKLEAASCLMIIALYVNERERRKKKRCFCFYIGREEKRERDRIKKLRFDMQWNILWQPLRRCSHWLYQEEEGLFLSSMKNGMKLRSIPSHFAVSLISYSSWCSECKEFNLSLGLFWKFDFYCWVYKCQVKRVICLFSLGWW